MEFSRQEYWSELPIPFPGDLPNAGIEPGSPALQAVSLTTEPLGKPKSNHSLSAIYSLKQILFFINSFINYFTMFSFNCEFFMSIKFYERVFTIYLSTFLIVLLNIDMIKYVDRFY